MKTMFYIVMQSHSLPSCVCVFASTKTALQISFSCLLLYAMMYMRKCVWVEIRSSSVQRLSVSKSVRNMSENLLSGDGSMYGDIELRGVFEED